jgi:DNA-directed RNA polymerase subunit RPC12/RpoP
MTTQRIGRLEVTVAGTRASLAGRIDETSATALARLATQLPAGDTTLDTDGVTFVNSIGMREWIRLIRVLRERGRVTLARVADVLITQMNLIPELGTSVTVVSFHAQYACGACGAEAAPVIDAVAHAADLMQMQMPPMPCPECGGKMELADFPERYLTMFKA